MTLPVKLAPCVVFLIGVYAARLTLTCALVLLPLRSALHCRHLSPDGKNKPRHIPLIITNVLSFSFTLGISVFIPMGFHVVVVPRNHLVLSCL